MITFECHSSTYPVSELLGWKRDNRLELRPDFQRKAVWSPAARVMLIDSVLTGVPIPKILLKGELRGTQTYRIVIDGQQRISTILSFINDEFPLNRPYQGEFQKRKFSQLPEDAQRTILNYRIDVNEIRNATDDQIREIYHRLNKYTFSLTSQEMRRADFPGVFLNVSENLAQLEFFEDSKIFTRASSKRMADVEFTSELLAILLDGPQDKKESLDELYVSYSVWDEGHCEMIQERFKRIIGDISDVFQVGVLELAKTRFRQKSDFYGLFGAINAIHLEGGILRKDNLGNLREDLTFLDYRIAPKSDIKCLSEYAVRCTSDANSLNSRKWRIALLIKFLRGSYFLEVPSAEVAVTFFGILRDIDISSYLCNSEIKCHVTGKSINWDMPQDYCMGWPKADETFQFTNSVILARSDAHALDDFSIVQLVESESEKI
jgi:hypothetical protein